MGHHPPHLDVYGAEPGLRFALLLDGHGGCTELGWTQVRAWKPEDGILWIHLERTSEVAAQWVNEASGLDSLAAEALLDEETRPRVEAIDDGLLIILRGVCATAPDEVSEALDDIDLVPLHLWVDGHRLISLRDTGHYMTALRDIRRALSNGKGPIKPGDLMTRIGEKLVRDLEPVLDSMDEEVDELDELIMQGENGAVRERLKLLRRRAVQLRRYMSPQRDALSRMEHDDAEWILECDRKRLREVTDKLLRFIDYLDAIRDRTTILHDDLSTAISERIARNSHRLAALAALLLPPSLVAGLFGMNVGGIPGVNDNWAFVIILISVAGVSVLTLWILQRVKWL